MARFFRQEYPGVLQSMEFNAMTGPQIDASRIQQRGFSEINAVGEQLRTINEFAAQVGRIGEAGSTAANITFTPAMLEIAAGPVHSETGSADVALIGPVPLIGKYHAWKIKNSFPVPGSMIVDDYRRRFLSSYASTAEMALVPARKEAELAAERKIAVLDAIDNYRLPTKLETLLAQLETVARDKEEAVSVNGFVEQRFPATTSDVEIFQMIRARKYLKLEEAFLRGNVSVGAIDPITGGTGLMLSVSLGSLTMVRLYLKAGADSSFTIARGISCLHCVYDALQRLKPTNARRRVSFLMTRDIISTLLEYGADANKSTPNGLTPLHMAAAFGYGDICAMLLRHGADRTLRDSHGRVPQRVAEVKGNSEAAQLIANWGVIEKSYRLEEWKMEWSKILKSNAALSRASKDAGRIRPGLVELGSVFSPEAVAKTKAAMWGLPSNPVDRALNDTAKMLEGMRNLDALAEHRATVNAAAGVDLAARNTDPRIAALKAVPAAEYDMVRDALRTVDHVADAEGAGETKRLRVIKSEVEKTDLTALAWSMRPTRVRNTDEKLLQDALLEEEETGEHAMEEERAEDDAIDFNLGCGEAEELALNTNARKRGASRTPERVGGKGNNNNNATPRKGRAPSPPPTTRPPRPMPVPKVNVVRDDETADRTEALYGAMGLGAYRPPHLLAAIELMEETGRITKAANEERKLLQAAEAIVQNAARATLIAGKRVKGLGSWKMTRFNTSYFVPDDEKELPKHVLEKKRLAAARKAVRSDFEKQTHLQSMNMMGMLARQKLYTEQHRVEEINEEEVKMDADEKGLRDHAM